MPNPQSTLDEALYKLTMVHLAKLEAYVPGPVKKAGGAKADLITRYKADPVFSIWGLDSVEYAALLSAVARSLPSIGSSATFTRTP